MAVVPDYTDTGGSEVDRRDEFGALLRRHQTQLFGYIYSLVRDFDDADDLLQQTSLVLWRKYDQYDPSKSFVVWACVIARLEAANFLRGRGRRRLYFSDDLSALLAEAHADLEHEDLEERREALAGCVKKLRPCDQELLQRCYEGSARIPEVARQQNRSTQSIHNSLHRIRLALQQCIHRSLGELGTG